MKNKIYEMFQGGFQSGQFSRIGDNKNLCMYIGRDERARFCFEFVGKFKPTRIVGSDVIAVGQTTEDNVNIHLRFSLEEADLLEHFSTFCEDLIESTSGMNNQDEAYQTLCVQYYSWKKLFRLSRKKLSETEIMGLLGELLFLRDHLFVKWGIREALDSWTGPEKTHKDFSANDTWYEIKTINAGKETVTISSIEQLDSDYIGFLVVYQLEKMSPSFDGLTLNGLVTSIVSSLTSPQQKESFLSKLDEFGFDFSPEYDDFVYTMADFAQYKVGDNFPRLSRTSNLPIAISKVQYDIILTEIQEYKL